MKKYWTTQEGEEIEYRKLEDSHLLNIRRWIERNAKAGMTHVYGGGFDGESMWAEEEYMEGEEVLEHYDYKGICAEIKRRKLK